MKYKLIYRLLFVILIFTACNKKLDTTPQNSIDASTALLTSSDVQAALIGAYSDLGAADFYGGRAFVGPDLLGNTDEIDWSGTYQGFTQIYNKSIPVDNGFVTDTWLTGYKTINDANNVLAALAVVDPTATQEVEGGAEFIRGSSYFDLVRLYAKAWNDGTPATNPGVPLVLTPTTLTTVTTDAKLVSRNTVAEVYAQVIKDLTDAKAKLPTSNGFYATTYVASAMLARVYLQMGDYTNAVVEANGVINSGEYELTKTYADAFPYVDPPAHIANTSEDVFALQVNNSSGFNGFQEFYSADGRGDITINQAHFDLYEADDDRLNLFYSSGGSDFTGKFDNLYGNVHIIRLAEMYLIRAEGNFRLNTAVGATPLEDINTIRERVLLPDLTTAELSLDAILKERKLELAFEGFTLHDAKRLQMPVANLTWNSPKLIYPIPKREIIVNANLTQNEGY